ncbi:hypothetical protein M2284_004797 [Rhodococcus sp. LBL1]|nr:hypothetical protein [Rhodococcus sp. LBL1]MDH6686111.1 hypothetical protein [Rhodococcus sp. LBL2]
MSELFVDPNDVDAFAKSVAELSAQADAARQYAEQWTSIGYNEGRMFVPVVEKLSGLHDVLSANYRRMSQLSADAANELTRAATMYRATDDASHDRIESTY